MKAFITILVVILCSKATAFQSNNSLYRSAIRSNLSSHDVVVGNEITIADDDTSTCDVCTRHSFLAKALVASSLPSLLLGKSHPAFADDIAGA